MKMYLMLFILLMPIYSHAERGDIFSAAKHYSELSKKYKYSLQEKDYEQAYSTAMKQLQLDPSDTIAYLRMAISAQHLQVDREKLRSENSPMISEQDIFHKQIKEIANSLLVN